MPNYSLNFEIIDICNLRCQMCDIWKNTEKHILTSDEISEILQHLQGNTLDITFTGGEPLLHPDIYSLIMSVYTAGYRINTLSTNGILDTKLIQFLSYIQSNGWKLPDIHISIDGFGETHDTQRGRTGAFTTSVQTIQKIRSLFPDVHLKLKYTITPLNIKDIKKIYTLAEKLQIDILYKPVHNDIFYTNRHGSIQELGPLSRKTAIQILGSILDLGIPYNAYLLEYLQTQKLPFACKTTEKSLFIMASGEVFPCTNYSSIGNIRMSSFSDIFYNHEHVQLNEHIAKIQCQKCFSPHGSYKTFS